MKMFELLPRPLGSIFRKLTHLTCNSRPVLIVMGVSATLSIIIRILNTIHHIIKLALHFFYFSLRLHFNLPDI